VAAEIGCSLLHLLQVWGVGGKFGTSAAVGIVLPPSAQMVEKQGWTYASRPNQILRKAHEAQSEISSLAFSQVRVHFCLQKHEVGIICNGYC
jgi:hypothetical protein